MLLTVIFLSLLVSSGFSVTVLQSPDQIVPSGADATLECSVGAGFSMSSYTMLWYRQNRHAAEIQLLLAEYETTAGRYRSSLQAEKNKFSLSIPELKVNDSSIYYCAARARGYEAFFGAGTKLTVLEDGAMVTGPEVKILRPSPNECRDQKKEKGEKKETKGEKKKEKGERRKTLVCVASGFYPDHVRVFWQINGQDITDGVATDAAAKKDERTKKFSITSRLRLQAKTWFNPDNEFTCRVAFYNGTTYTNHPASIKSNETDTGMTREKYLKITQNAKLSYSALIVKSCLYAALVCLLVWRLQSSPKKRKQ